MLRENPFTIDLKVSGLEYSEDANNEMSKIMDDIWQRYPRAQIARRHKEGITFEVF